ncbi:MAG: FAD-binding protein [Asgard group archaeon]|nr:FAD-binding protein [Asgard group archaeon]
MFSSIKRSSSRVAKQWIRYNSRSTIPIQYKTPWLTYALLGVGFLGTGFILGNALTSNEASALEPTDRSTSPLSSLLSPVYANDDEFKKGVAKIVDIVGKENVSFDIDVLKSQNDSFYTTHHPPNPEVQRPSAVVFPTSTEEVSQILKVAHEYRIPIVANSGLTSLEGHNMHTRGPNSISVSFQNMNQIIAFHPEDLDIVVQPGVGWQELDDFLLGDEQGKDLKFGPDPGIGANIGGMVGTSASGTNAFKYGTMKENVVNLTVVLADGTVIKTRQRPRKSSAGYDLTRLFIGNEGTLGLVTEITLKLHVRPKFEYITVAAFPSIKDATSAAASVISKGVQPNAMELVNDTMMAFVNETSDPDKKSLETATLFFKLGGPTEESAEEQAKLVEEIAKNHKVIKLQKSTNAEENEELWAARRNGLWSTFQFGTKVLADKNDVQLWTTDVAVPVSKLSPVITEINDYLIEEGLKNKFSVLGHIGDGNCHFLIIYNSPDYEKIHHVVDHLVSRAIEYEGTCTGEHGVGVGKRRYLPMELGETTVDTMRQIKLALDPRRILNPDKIFKIDPNENLDEQLDKGSVREVPHCMNNH